jgi:hypothetical protein
MGGALEGAALQETLHELGAEGADGATAQNQFDALDGAFDIAIEEGIMQRCLVKELQQNNG